MRIEFATAERIIFGEGVAHEIGREAVEFGGRALVVTGRSPERAAAVIEEIGQAGVEVVGFSVDGEPTISTVRQGAALGAERRVDQVISIGGGSAIDAGKAIAALLTNGGDVLDYLEVVGQGRPLQLVSAPFIAVPTTAGTGSEVTRNAVLASPEHCVKASLRSPYLLPSLAVVDPELTYDLPPAGTAVTGLDALTQLMEAYVSVKASPITDPLCLDGLRRAATALPRAYADGLDHDARHDMALASLFSGIALANAGLGAVHGFAAPIGGMFPAPHGAVCAALLPHVIFVNIRALRSRASAQEPLNRYRTVARILTGHNDAAPEDAFEWTAATCNHLRVPPLRAYGVSEDDVDILVGKAARASSMKGNPVALTVDELAEILHRAL